AGAVRPTSLWQSLYHLLSWPLRSTSQERTHRWLIISRSRRTRPESSWPISCTIRKRSSGPKDIRARPVPRTRSNRSRRTARARKPSTKADAGAARRSAGRLARYSFRFVARQSVDPLVFRVAGVAFHPLPGNLVARRDFDQLVPQIGVAHRFL